jgi:hypothetical protein
MRGTVSLTTAVRTNRTLERFARRVVNLQAETDPVNFHLPGYPGSPRSPTMPDRDRRSVGSVSNLRRKPS